MSEFKQNPEEILEQMKSLANTDTVVGKEFQMGEFTCVPVISVRVGFGSGGGEGDSKQGKGNGGGIGAGVNVEPIAFLVTRGDQISLLNVKKGKGLETLFEKMPEMMDKVSQFTSKKED